MASRIIKELLSDSDSDEYLRIPPRKKSKSTTRHSGTRAKSKLGLFSSSSGSDSCTEDVADEDISKVRDDMSATTKKGSFRSITKRSRDGCQKVTKTMSTPRAHSDKSPSCTPTSLSRRSSSHSTPSHQSHAKPKVLQYAKENDDSANNSQITHHLLKKIISKLDGYGQRIQAIEEKLDCNTTCSSETSTGTNSKSKGRKKEIPNVVRAETRRIYHMLMEEDIDGFQGWTIGPGYSVKVKVHVQYIHKRISRGFHQREPWGIL